MIILGTNSIKETGYDVANSCRFNSGDSAVLKRTHGTPTNAKKFVWSAWIKRSKLGADQYFVQNYTDGSNLSMAYFRSGDDIRIFDRHGTGDGTDTVWISDAKFRDTSAWMHFLLKVDTTQSTDSDRFQVYINGSLATGNGITYPALNADMNWTAASASNRHSIAATSDGYNYVGGYLCEVVLVDGTSPAHTDFGEFDSDSGIWKPINVSGLTFGNNGYYLDFADSGDLGDDESGNGNDFTETNLAATDQSTDTCTNNFCTWNPIANYTNSVAFSEGNLVAMSGTNDQWDSGRATMGFSKGKWYFECLFVAGVSTQYIGVVDESCKMNVANAHNENGTTIYYNNGGGEIRKDGSFTSADYGTFSSSEVAGIAIDADNFTISVYKGGSAIVSAYALSTTRTGFLFPMTTLLNNGDGVKVNFGSPPYSESGGNTDANGYGNFNQSVPSGYFAINTKNLAEYG